jgi:ribonuclease P protein subunit POP4
MRTKKNLARHELIGLNVWVIESTDPTLKSLNGMIIDETKNTFKIEVNGKIKKISKSICKFRFKLDDGFVDVAGKSIVGRPQDRIKK